MNQSTQGSLECLHPVPAFTVLVNTYTLSLAKSRKCGVAAVYFGSALDDYYTNRIRALPSLLTMPEI
ncbi:hypothetical protein [Hoylesella enoeca]|uniref:hypothetical protein n=1 Tax=Hoylesella enoeca TaxID=76123 RepID=UPI0012E3D077|nr:hypothetical protein [Hoylesella enoeca]